MLNIISEERRKNHFFWGEAMKILRPNPMQIVIFARIVYPCIMAQKRIMGAKNVT